MTRQNPPRNALLTRARNSTTRPSKSGRRPRKPEAAEFKLADYEGGVREMRIHRIFDIMYALKWRRGKTGVRLAGEWGVTEVYVRELAAEASKRVLAEVADKDEVRRDLGVTLRQAMLDCRSRRQYRALARLAIVWAKVAQVDEHEAPPTVPSSVTVVQVGQFGTSPAMKALVGKANGVNGVHAASTINGASSEGADELPTGSRRH